MKRIEDCRHLLLGLLGLLDLATTASLLAQPAVPIGAEFQVNSYTSGAQADPAVALDSDGDFVIVWRSRDQDGSSYGIFAQRFDSAGAAEGGEFQVNELTENSQGGQRVAFGAGGDFVVAWGSFGHQGAEGAYGVFARRYDSAGTAQATEFQVNTYTEDGQFDPAIATDSDGDFVIAWASAAQDGSLDGIFGQRFDSAGVAVASEFQVNSYTSDHQSFTAVALDPDGDFVIAWSSQSQDGASYGVFAQRFDSAGAAQAAEFQVNTYTLGDQYFARAAFDDAGSFLVVWRSRDQDGSGSGIFAQRFDSAGLAQAAEFQVTTFTAGNQAYGSVDYDGTGNFVVTWNSADQDGSVAGVFGRHFDSAGVAQAAEFQINSFTLGYQVAPSLAVGAGGDFVVSWSSDLQDGGVYGVFAQRFGMPPASVPLDVDGNGETAALTDGLLVLRYLFSFTGTTLTNGAIDTGDCTRCDGAAVSAYLSGLGLTLDIDGDGETGALTDGLLVLRYLFSFTGTTLTNGVVDTSDCTRCAAGEIEPYLLTLI